MSWFSNKPKYPCIHEQMLRRLQLELNAERATLHMELGRYRTMYEEIAARCFARPDDPHLLEIQEKVAREIQCIFHKDEP